MATRLPFTNQGPGSRYLRHSSDAHITHYRLLLFDFKGSLMREWNASELGYNYQVQAMNKIIQISYPKKKIVVRWSLDSLLFTAAERHGWKHKARAEYHKHISIEVTKTRKTKPGSPQTIISHILLHLRRNGAFALFISTQAPSLTHVLILTIDLCIFPRRLTWQDIEHRSRPWFHRVFVSTCIQVENKDRLLRLLDRVGFQGI